MCQVIVNYGNLHKINSNMSNHTAKTRSGNTGLLGKSRRQHGEKKLPELPQYIRTSNFLHVSKQEM